MTGRSPLEVAVLALGCATLTLGAYRLSLAVRRRWAHPLTTGAVAGVSLGIGAVLTAVAAPLLVTLLAR
ncbi:MAG: hypothetical protein M3N49_12130 [Candidatus Eremiobacteraeota bacterium]|nr:hypothetical protein [Candidatus Eremiobacteraeota bacterium]